MGLFSSKSNKKFSFKPKEGFSNNRGISSIGINPFYDRCLSLSKAARNWQIAFLVMSCFSACLLFAYFRLANKTQLVPYVIEIDRDKGSVVYTGRMVQTDYTVDDALIFAMLNDFVINMRSISLDKVFTYKKFKREYSFLGKEMKNKMNAEINSIGLEKKFKEKMSVDVQVTSMLKSSEGIYQLYWTEKSYKDGSLIETTRMTGNFSVIQDINISEEDRKINPLGLIIQDYHIARDISL